MGINSLPPIFYPSEVDIDKELFAPVASVASSLDCMVGYFTSGMLSELSRAIVSYLKTEKNAPLRFVISPFLTEKDLFAIKNAYKLEENFFNILFPNFQIDEESLRTRTITVLSYLISIGKIELKIALVDSGIFHTKAWLFDTPLGKIAIHGSSNATVGGLSKNFEQLVLNRSWTSKESDQIVQSLNDRFESFWSDTYQGIEVLPLNQETIRYVEKIAPKGKENFKKLDSSGVMSVDELERELLKLETPELKIPNYLCYNSGEYAHQGEAVNAWLNNNKHGILSIATGGGKTITSLIAAAKVMQEQGDLFLLIAVPTKALMNQWEEEIKEFSINPINTNGYPINDIKREVKDALRRLRLKVSRAEVVIVTHEAVSGEKLRDVLSSPKTINSMLIVDEVHNIGSKRSQLNFPTEFQFKLGLSATPIRQFDEEGTEFLLDTFQGVVYEFGLDRAIGSCLVNYNYYAYFVTLTAIEEDEFIDITRQIKKLTFASELGDSSKERQSWELLCIKRRSIVESAANKVRKLAQVLPEDNLEINKTLIFCTDKNPSQLEQVNELLHSRSLKFHQVTAEETGNNNKLKRIIQSFADDKLQVLTSKRVLDEGFNVPQTEKAYLLASNTVVRQWMQRLGRVLRVSHKTGKKTADIHDFIVLPVFDGELDKDLRALLNTEYKRVHFFSQYSINYMDENGGYKATEKILEMLGVE